MPVVFRDKGRRFHFCSDEGTPREPVHVHVSEAEREAKFWFSPRFVWRAKSAIVTMICANWRAS